MQFSKCGKQALKMVKMPSLIIRNNLFISYNLAIGKNE